MAGPCSSSSTIFTVAAEQLQITRRPAFYNTAAILNDAVSRGREIKKENIYKAISFFLSSFLLFLKIKKKGKRQSEDTDTQRKQLRRNMEDDEIEEGMLVEEEAVQSQKKPEKSPYEMLQESKSSVEEIVTKMLAIKQENKPKSELRELVTQMFLNFVTLRQVLKLS